MGITDKIKKEVTLMNVVLYSSSQNSTSCKEKYKMHLHPDKNKAKILLARYSFDFAIHK